MFIFLKSQVFFSRFLLLVLDVFVLPANILIPSWNKSGRDFSVTLTISLIFFDIVMMLIAPQLFCCTCTLSCANSLNPQTNCCIAFFSVFLMMLCTDNCSRHLSLDNLLMHCQVILACILVRCWPFEPNTI